MGSEAGIQRAGIGIPRQAGVSQQWRGTHGDGAGHQDGAVAFDHHVLADVDVLGNVGGDLAGTASPKEVSSTPLAS